MNIKWMIIIIDVVTLSEKAESLDEIPITGI